jgi:hypothetical protein
MNKLSYEKIPRRWCAAVTLILATILVSAPRAQAEDDATAILRSMSDYLARQKTISLTFDSDVEVITSDLQKLQFTGSGQVLLSRPDKLRATRTGGYTDVELVFDGKTATVLGKNLNTFAQIDSQGSVDQLINRLNGDAVAMPGSDLLLSNVFDELTANVSDAKHIGQGVIDGIECEHLAFRNADTDWQIWIEIGSNPVPRKYVITSKSVTGAPQYTLRIKDWKTNVPVAADAFVFKAPEGAKKVDLAALSDIDEIPQGIIAGAKGSERATTGEKK